MFEHEGKKSTSANARMITQRINYNTNSLQSQSLPLIVAFDSKPVESGLEEFVVPGLLSLASRWFATNDKDLVEVAESRRANLDNSHNESFGHNTL